MRYVTIQNYVTLLSCFCLLAAIGGLSNSCEARPQEKQATEGFAKTEGVSTQKSSEPNVDSSSAPADPQANSYYDNSLGPHLLKDFGYEQKAIWTSPIHLRLIDADWLVPLGIAVGVTLATDTETSKHLSNSPTRLKLGKDFSDYGVASMAAAGGGLYLWGHFTHDDHRRETGLLAGEAAVNSLVATYALKYALGRERPLEDNFHGSFWQRGDSFPSEHAAAAWSIASVIGHEYPSPFVRFVAYGLATAVSASRVDAKQHFQADVLVGSAIGWFSGEVAYRLHHDPEIGGVEWETYAESRDESPAQSSSNAGSPYVELDSWIYPAIERLAALNYIRSAFLGMRPWTRIECAHLVDEAGDQIAAEGESASGEAGAIYDALQQEFQADIDASGGESEKHLRLESLYSSTTDINGKPLNDSYHFGQTIINNYGRPYQEGLNTYDGFSGYGTAGRFTLYVRGEYQHAPFAPAYSLAIRQEIAALDSNPLQPATPFPTVNQFRLLDAYIAAKVAGWDFALGKQSLWWGPGEGGDLMFSDNAEPIYMARASRVAPFTLPWIFHWLGPMKWDVFVGKLSGNEFPPRPLIHGEKISFKPTPNLEVGFSRVVEFGGVGRPITPAAIWNSYTSFSKSSALYAFNNNPGKRTGGADFSYRVPYLRNWLTLYSGSLADDDPSALKNPPRAAYNSGIYMPHLPGVPKLDFRVEAVYTALPIPGSVHGHFVYFDSFYHDLYTNKSNLIGSWIGREGQGIQAWSTYWFSPRNSLQFGYRHAKVDKDFIPSGETVNDGSAKISWWIHNSLSLSGSIQYEKWFAPILAPSPQTNWTSSVEIAFYPHSWSW
jgi:Capsule assembly protein Wzi/PAP2 superfamily